MLGFLWYHYVVCESRGTLSTVSIVVLRQLLFLFGQANFSQARTFRVGSYLIWITYWPYPWQPWGIRLGWGMSTKLG